MIGTTQIYIFLGAVILSFSAGAYVQHKFNLASKLESLYEEIDATQKGQISSEILASNSNIKKNELFTEHDAIKEKLYDETAKNPSACTIPNNVLELLRQSAKAANSASARPH